jgi:hypothetical protein
LISVFPPTLIPLRSATYLTETPYSEIDFDALGIDRSNLAAIAAELSDRDLVERSRHAVDRRRQVLRLSRRGERLLRRTEGAIADAEADLLAPLGHDQRPGRCALFAATYPERSRYSEAGRPRGASAHPCRPQVRSAKDPCDHVATTVASLVSIGTVPA